MSPAASDSGNEAATKTKKKSSTKSKKEEVEEVQDSENNSDAGDEDEEEYEIEAILEAKKGRFPEGKLGYLVKWKGYSNEHNSWVVEEDAANAKELIDKYWAAEKKASPKKSAEPSKRPRKSVGADNASDGGSAGGSPRARTNDKDDEERPAKKPRKSSQKKAATSSPEPMQEDEEIGNMSEHMNAPAWDHLIKNIDTVERSDNKLFVYFTLKENNERIREESGVCAEKFPKMLIHFYEQNLRWKEADHNE
ncbi:hypothetical protein C8J57DRAFT_1578139 [Mycena rebaudengoi]|nr:hypothetical protein C8J57DRAFT_1578139 [Mycena rebaudengoi]